MRKGLYIDPPDAERVTVPFTGAEVARRRTREIVKLWHWELPHAPDRQVPGLKHRTMHEDPMRDLAASCYLQGVADAAEAVHRMGTELPRPLARIVAW